MGKLEGWSPRRRGFERREPELPPLEMQEDDWFSFHQFNKPDHAYTTRGALVAKFYEWNVPDEGINPWITMSFDPPKYTPPGSHTYWFVHYQDFYVRIDPNMRSPQGIHRARLYYRQSGRRGNLWLASCQIGPMYFFSASKICAALIEAIAQKKFFISEKSARQVVDK